MRTAEKEPTLFEDIGALADLYVGVFRLMGRRLSHRTHKRAIRVVPEDMLPPPMPDWRTEQHPTLISRRN